MVEPRNPCPPTMRIGRFARRKTFSEKPAPKIRLNHGRLRPPITIRPASSSSPRWMISFAGSPSCSDAAMLPQDPLSASRDRPGA